MYLSYSWGSGCRIGETFRGLNKFKIAVMCTSLIFRSWVYIFFLIRNIYNVRPLWPLLMYRSKYHYNCNVFDLNIQNFESLVPNFEHQIRFFSAQLQSWPLKILRPKFVDNFMNKVIPRIISYCNYSKQWPWRPIAIVISTRYRLLNTQAYTRIQVYIQLR